MERSIFAMELCFRYDADVHALLREHVKNHPKALGHHEKWTVYRNAQSDLLTNLHRVERGCWDYYNDDERARHDYAMWVHGMMTDETARTSPTPPNDPYRPAPRYMTFTMAFLILQETPTDAAMFELCNIPQEKLWQRETFAHILQGIGVINFASIESDIMYIIPRDEDWVLTPEDLSEPKFEYLRPLY